MTGVSDTHLLQVSHDEVLTGEAVALDLQPVGVMMRAVGAVIDMAVTVLIALGVVWLLSAAQIDSAAVQMVLVVTMVLLLVVLPTAVETLSRGRSLGKLAIGARIVRADGGAIGFRQAFIRALVGVLEIWFTLGGGALLVGLFTPRGQRLGDLSAGTYSERVRVPTVPARPLYVPAQVSEWMSVADVARLPVQLARRVAQFTENAAKMAPGARARLAADLADQVRPYVNPVPPVDPETLLWAVTAARRVREQNALARQARRVAALRGSRRAPGARHDEAARS